MNKLFFLLFLNGCVFDFPTIEQIHKVEPLLDMTAPLTGGLPVIKYILLGITGIIAIKKER